MMKSTCAEPRKECVRAPLVIYHSSLCTRFRVPVKVNEIMATILKLDHIKMLIG